MNATRFVEFNDGLCVKYHPDVDYHRIGCFHEGVKQFRDMWETRADFERHKDRMQVVKALDAAMKA